MRIRNMKRFIAGGIVASALVFGVSVVEVKAAAVSTSANKIVVGCVRQVSIPVDVTAIVRREVVRDVMVTDSVDELVGVGQVVQDGVTKNIVTDRWV